MDRLGQPLPPRKPEKRTPKYWLIRDENDLFFVNNTEEILEQISASTHGFTTYEDEMIPVGGKCYEFENVIPREAVRVEEFEPMTDSDYVLQVEIRIQSKQGACLKMLSPSKKGGMTGESVLQWDTGEAGKWVSISECE